MARFAFDLDLHTAAGQTPQSATWVQAKCRRRAVGRAAWMPRERRQDMDVRSARVHGASSECGYPTQEGQARSQTLGCLLKQRGGSFQVTRRRRNSLAVRTNHTVSVTQIVEMRPIQAVGGYNGRERGGSGANECANPPHSSECRPDQARSKKRMGQPQGKAAISAVSF